MYKLGRNEVIRALEVFFVHMYLSCFLLDF